MNILGIIPARKGSKTVKQKNIRELCRKPLIQYTIDAAILSGSLNDICITSDDEIVLEIARKNNVIAIERPSELAQDETLLTPVIKHCLTQINKNYDAFIILQPTSPLRNDIHINNCIKQFIADKTNSIVSGYEAPHQFSPSSLITIDENNRAKNIFDVHTAVYRKQDKIKAFVRNGAIYLSKICVINNMNKVFDDNDYTLFLMSQLSSIDIDTEFDFQFTEFIISKQININWDTN